MTQWKDATSYSRGERGQTEPRSWEIRMGHEYVVNVTVTRHIDYGNDAWLMLCFPLFPKGKLLESKDLADAKVEALTIVEEALRHAHNAVEAHLDVERG